MRRRAVVNHCDLRFRGCLQPFCFDDFNFVRNFVDIILAPQSRASFALARRFKVRFRGRHSTLRIV